MKQMLIGLWVSMLSYFQLVKGDLEARLAPFTNSENGTADISEMIGVLLLVVVFAALTPVVATQVAGVNTSAFPGGAATLFGLTTLFYVLMGFTIIVKYIR